MFQLLKSRIVLFGVGVVIVAGSILWVVRGWLLHRVLPDILEKQLTQTMDREIAFGDLGLSFVQGYFSVSGLKIAKGKSLKEGTMIAAKQVVIRFKFIRFLLHPSDPVGAVKRIELEEPYVELDASLLADDGNGKKRKKKNEEPAALPQLPRTYMRLRGGTVVLTRRGREIMQFSRIKGDLDLRDFPRVEGNLKFSVPPESTVSMNGYCHFSLRSFGGALSIESLDLAQISELIAVAAPGTPVKVAGRLTAEVEVRGGFMTMTELFRELSGRGSLKLENGGVYFRGAPILTETFVQGNMDDRTITLESLSARMLEGALTASGRLSDLGFGSVRLKGRLEKVPLRALKSLSPGLPPSVEGETSLEFSMTGTGTNPVVSAKLVAPVAGIAGIRFENMTALAVGSRSEVRLSSIKARFWDGIVEGGAEAGGWDKGKLQVKADLSGRGLNVARSPLGNRYEGRGELDARVEGPLDRLKGEAKVKITELKARGKPNSDITVSAKMDGGNIKVEARNASKSVTVGGLLVLGQPGGIRCEGCRLDLQDRISALLTLAGVEPPAGLEGRGSAVVRVEGPLADSTITVEAFASGVKLGKMAIGDQIRMPKLVFKKSTLIIPASAPLELAWGPENTRARAWGKVPVSTFTGKGDQALNFHLECLMADAAILKRLNLLKEANGGFDLAADIAGTAAFPIFWSLTLNGSGKKLATTGQVFLKPMEKWRLKARISDGEGVLDAAEFYVDKQRFGLINEEGRPNRFVLTGRSLSALDVGIETDWERGLPVVIEDVVDIRLKARVRAVKDSASEELWIIGPEAGKGAVIEVSQGKIMFAGGGGGGGKKKGKEKGKLENTEPEKPSVFSEWAKRSLCILGTVTFGKNVRYQPPSLSAKLFAAATEAVTGNMDGFGRMGGGGIMGAMRGALLDFDVVVKEGSAIKIGKERAKVTAGGKLALEPGGKLILRVGLTPYEFTLVDEAGLRHEVEFQPGEDLAANVSATGEILFRDAGLRTDDNKLVAVEELRIRINVRPPDEVRDSEVKRALEASRAFLRYTMKLASEPEVITGQVADPVTSSAVGAAGSGSPAGAGGGGGGVARLITFRPSQRALLLALTGIDQAADQPAAPGDSAVKSAVKTFLEKTGVWVVADVLIARPIKAVLDIIGLRPDVFKLQKSETVEASRSNTQAVGGVAGGTASTMGGNAQFMADVLRNSEVTIGKSITRNLYMNWHVVLLDANALLGSRNSTELAATKTNMTGVIAELEYRTSQYKAKTRYRAFGLPDDPKPEQPREGYLGLEMNQGFSGVSQRERFVW